MPNSGDEIYQCLNGDLLTAAFYEESVAEGASEPSWLIEECHVGEMKRVPIGEWFATEYEAFLSFSRLIDQKIVSEEDAIERAVLNIKRLRRQKYAARISLDKRATGVTRLDAGTREILNYLLEQKVRIEKPLDVWFYGETCHVAVSWGMAVVSRASNGFLQYESFLMPLS